jgi:hypothetical protein
MGRCYFRTNPGDFTTTTNANIYAAARLLSPKGTVQRPVRTTNQQATMQMLTCT